MPEIGGGKLAAELKGVVRLAVEKAKEQARARVGAALAELSMELRTGSEQVAKAIEADILAARKEFSDVIGNVNEETEQEVNTVAATTNGTGEQPALPNGGGAS